MSGSYALLLDHDQNRFCGPRDKKLAVINRAVQKKAGGLTLQRDVCGERADQETQAIQRHTGEDVDPDSQEFKVVTSGLRLPPSEQNRAVSCAIRRDRRNMIPAFRNQDREPK